MLKLTAAVLVAAAASVASAGFTVDYDGEGSPADLGINFVVFGGTSWNTNGGSLNMTTAPVQGIWMGAFQSNPFVPVANTDGNYLKLDVKMGEAAVEWSAYINDGSHGAAISFDHNGFTYGLAGETRRVDTDLTDGFSTFEILLKDGLVSYSFDGQLLANRTAASEQSTAPIWLVGDGSGSTPTGAGSMSVDNLTFIAGPDFDQIPAPGAVTVLAAAGLLASRRRR